MPQNKMRPIHPGEVLQQEFLVALNITAHALSMRLHVPAPRIHDIVREKRGISTDTALRLGRYFGTTPEFWLNLQQRYDLQRSDQMKINNEVEPMAA